jgi:cobalt-zinc-cadmium efflux system protein
MVNEHLHYTELTRQATIRLALSLGITFTFVIGEAVAGYFANSLALLTDAAHNLTDVIALALSLWALNLTLRPSNPRKTYGYHRSGILIALLNATTLVIISLGIFYEAYHRLISPPEVQAGIIVIVGAIAFFVNLATAWLVKHGSEHDLNIRSAFVHLMGDVFATLGAMLAGVIIYFTGAYWIDPLVSIFIGFLIIWNAWGIMRESLNILMESTPSDLDMNSMIQDILEVPGVLDVHDLHAWSITYKLRTLSAHVVVEDILVSSSVSIQDQINQLLRDKYGIEHVTLQFECFSCEPGLLYCDITVPNHNHRVNSLPSNN